MKALTIQQPWAGLLVLGIKKFETRSWNTKHRGILAIHSSAKMNADGKQLLKWLTEDDPDNFFPGSEAYTICTQQGVVLGAVEIIDTHSTNGQKKSSLDPLEKVFGNYNENRWFWECKNPIIYPSPVPAIGKLSLWNWTPQVEAKT